MTVLKAGGTIFGAKLTSAERKALNIEIDKAMAETDRKNVDEIDAMILWQLHQQLGWGYVRLKKFYDAFNAEYQALLDRYEMHEEGDGLFLVAHKLKEECGIDISEWNKSAKVPN